MFIKVFGNREHLVKHRHWCESAYSKGELPTPDQRYGRFRSINGRARCNALTIHGDWTETVKMVNVVNVRHHGDYAAIFSSCHRAVGSCQQQSTPSLSSHWVVTVCLTGG